MGGTASFLPHHSPPHFSMVRGTAVLAQVDAEEFLPQRRRRKSSWIFILYIYIWSSPPPLVPFHNRFSCAQSTLERNQHWIKIKTLIIHRICEWVHRRGRYYVRMKGVSTQCVFPAHIAFEREMLWFGSAWSLICCWEHTRSFSRKPSAAKGFWCLWDASCLAGESCILNAFNKSGVYSS